jgi:hypothetical protein
MNNTVCNMPLKGSMTIAISDDEGGSSFNNTRRASNPTNNNQKNYLGGIDMVRKNKNSSTSSRE